MKRYFIKITLILVLFLNSNYSNIIEDSRNNELLNMSIKDLMNIKISSAGKKPEIVSDIPASVSIISRKEIEQYGYHSLNDILRNIAGLYAIDNRDFSSMVFGVRGYWSGWPRNFIILVNDVEQTNSYGMYHMQNIHIPVESIDRIEVIRGPMSVIYGSGAFLGVINIVTNESPASLVSGSYGSHNTKKTFLRFSNSQNDLKLVFNGGYFDTYGPDEPLSRMVSDMSSLEDTYGISDSNNNTTTKGRLEHRNLSFNLNGTYKNLFANFCINQSEREEYHFWPSFSDGLLNKMKFSTIHLGYKKIVKEYLSLKGSYKYVYSSYWREFDYFIKDFYGQELDDANRHTIEFNVLYNPAINFDVMTGIRYENYKRASKLDLRDIYLLNTGGYYGNQEKLAVFSQINYQLSSKIKFVAGGRIEKQFKLPFKYFNNETDEVNKYEYELEGLEVLPRFALIYTINKNNILKLLYGKAVKFPTNIDIVHQLISGDKNLESEYIDTYEMNYFAKLFSNYSLNLSLFQNNEISGPT